MLQSPDLLVFTDLDGSLIDHETYSWQPARPALARLQSVNAGVVLASSKTVAEMTALRTELGLTVWPAIIENGAGCLPADSERMGAESQYVTLRAVLDQVASERRSLFRGFGDMTAEDVAQMTGLSLEASELARCRDFSEPGVWSGTPAQRASFEEELARHGVIAQQGGRFLTLSFGGNKAQQMRGIVETYRPRHTVALGDAPNDIAMLEAADFGVVIFNSHGQTLPELQGEAEGRIIRTNEAGPLGWNKAILQLLDQLDLT